MSPNPLTSAATWALALTVDAVALVVAAVVVLWDRHCTPGSFACPAAGDRVGRDALALGLLAVVLLAVALLALVRGRLLLVLVQLALVAAAAYAAHHEAPQALDRLRHDLHLAWALLPLVPARPAFRPSSGRAGGGSMES